MTQGRRKSMAEKREILIELKKGSSIRKISRELHVHRDIIRSLVDIAETQGWLHPDAEIPSEEDMNHIIQQKNKATHVLDNYNAKEIGPNTYAFCQKTLSNPHVDKLIVTHKSITHLCSTPFELVVPKTESLAIFESD